MEKRLLENEIKQATNVLLNIKFGNDSVPPTSHHPQNHMFFNGHHSPPRLGQWEGIPIQSPNPEPLS